jgi:hypothetical protein
MTPLLCVSASRKRNSAVRRRLSPSSSGTPAAYRGWGCGARPRGPRAAALARPSGGSASGPDSLREEEGKACNVWRGCPEQRLRSRPN